MKSKLSALRAHPNDKLLYIPQSGISRDQTILGFFRGHGFIGYPKGRNVERALGFSLTGTVSTSPNLAKEEARSATIITRPSARTLAKFGEVDTVPVSEKYTKSQHRGNSVPVQSRHFDL